MCGAASRKSSRSPSASGRGQKIVRCPQCHIALWSHYSGAGQGIAFLRVGTLDSPGLSLEAAVIPRLGAALSAVTAPLLLILDDATSAVDTETERLIQLALERLMEGRTSFIIAQRLGTVRAADLILVLDKGRIAARGSHEELLNTSGLYAEIYHRQFRPQELAAARVQAGENS